MELTRDFDEGIVERIGNDPAFAKAILDEIDELLLAGDAPVACEMIRILTVGTIGFDILSRSLAISSEALERRLSDEIHDDFPPLNKIVGALKRELGVAAN